MSTKVVKHISMVLLMLVTGVFWGTWFTMTRSIGEFSPTEFIHIGKVIIANVAGPMKLLMPASILFLSLATWMEYRGRSNAFYPLTVSLILMIVSLLITVLIEVPIDDQIKTWTALKLPSNWEDLRQKWAYYHMMRTFTSIGSFVLFSIGSLVLTKSYIPA